MSKKKNTLRDLDDFLKQQASALVIPEPADIAPAAELLSTNQIAPQVPQDSPSTLEKHFEREGDTREKLYDFIIHSLEKRADPSPEDTVLINTTLYLKNGENWKEAIRQYWKNK
jgi:hypothetical protein